MWPNPMPPCPPSRYNLVKTFCAHAMMNLRNSHYESEQLEVKWPQKSDETGADGTFQRTKRPAEDFDDDRKPLVTPVAVRVIVCGSQQQRQSHITYRTRSYMLPPIPELIHLVST